MVARPCSLNEVRLLSAKLGPAGAVGPGANPGLGNNLFFLAFWPSGPFPS